MAYIYEIINDINNKSYIGKTEFAIERRFKEHCKEAFRNRCEKRPLYAAMRKYGIEHFHIELLEETESPEEREIFWISTKQTYKQGYNATLGGDGKKYLDYDLVVTAYKQLGTISAVADRLNIHRETVRKILRIKQVDVRTSSEVLLEKTGKAVEQYSLTGEYIATFPSTLAAVKALGKVQNKQTDRGSAGHIADVCNGKRKTAYGYIWCYQII